MTEPNQTEEVFYPAEIPATTHRMEMTESFPAWYLKEFAGGSAALHIYLNSASKPEGWVFRKETLMAEAGIKKAAWGKAVAVLKAAGVYKIVTRSKKGDFGVEKGKPVSSIAIRSISLAMAEKLFWGNLKQLTGEPRDRLKALGKLEFEYHNDWAKTDYSVVAAAFANGIMPSGYVKFRETLKATVFNEIPENGISCKSDETHENAESHANQHQVPLSGTPSTSDNIIRDNNISHTREGIPDAAQHPTPDGSADIESDLRCAGVSSFPDPVGLEPRIEDPTHDDCRKQTERFLNRFPGRHTFQTFDDTENKSPTLARIFQGLDRPALYGLNQDLAGVFLTINETDGKGRRATNIVKIRAVFGDFDGTDPTPAFADRPHVIVESSPGRFHAYWMVDNDFPLEGFRGVQEGIIRKFNSDPKVKDLPRVMRLPGFHHCKEAPFMTQVRGESFHAPLSYAEAVEMFPPDPKEQWSAPKYQENNTNTDEFKGQRGVSAGGRNNHLARILGGAIKRGLSGEALRDEAFREGRACNPPMSDREIEHTYKSILRTARR